MTHQDFERLIEDPVELTKAIRKEWQKFLKAMYTVEGLLVDLSTHVAVESCQKLSPDQKVKLYDELMALMDNRNRIQGGRYD